jgi:hypothetical protein
MSSQEAMQLQQAGAQEVQQIPQQLQNPDTNINPFSSGGPTREPVAPASAGKSVLVVVNAKDHFDAKTGELNSDGEDAMESAIKKSCTDRIVARDMMRNYCRLAERLQKKGVSATGEFTLLAWTCVLRFVDETTGGSGSAHFDFDDKQDEERLGTNEDDEYA